MTIMLYTVDEAANIMGFDADWVREIVAAGKLAALQETTGWRRLYITDAAIEAYRACRMIGEIGHCQQCSGDFVRRSPTQRFCSNGCRELDRQINQRGMPATTRKLRGRWRFEDTCPQCGQRYWRMPHQIYCSRKCNQHAYEHQLEEMVDVG